MLPEQNLIVSETSLIKYKTATNITNSKSFDNIKNEGKQYGINKNTLNQSPNQQDASKSVEITEGILNNIIPPKKFKIKDEIYIQEVSSCPASRIDVIQLTQQLDKLLEIRGAKMTGICPIRRELFTQIFDELIRQLTIHCAERGLLLLRVRNEVVLTIAALQSIYTSGVVFGLQKSLAQDADNNKQIEKVESLKNDIAQLRKRVELETMNCRAIGEKEANRLAAATRRAEDDIAFLHKNHDQLKSQLESLLLQLKMT